MAHYPHSFGIHRQIFSIHLGYYDGERAVPQPIAVDIRLYFGALPTCARTDKAPFIDYAILIEAIRTFIEGKEFSLIEHLAAEFFAIARSIMDAHCPSEDIKLWVRVTKLKPPIQGLEGGASFVTSDLPAGASCVATL